MSQLLPRPLSRRAALNILLGRTVGGGLGTCRWSELVAAAHDENHPFVLGWSPREHERLRAAMRLCTLYFPEQPSPTAIRSLADLTRYFDERCRELRDRCMWLLCLDPAGSVKHELLVLYGGTTTAVPPLRTLLRHALLRGAERAWVVDYRPIEYLEADAETVGALHGLSRLAEIAGFVVEDWVLLGPNGAVSVRAAVTAELPNIAEAA